MSLIADALKAAQQERSGSGNRAETAARQRVATSALRASASASRGRPFSEGISRSLWISMLALAVTLVGTALFVSRLPEPVQALESAPRSASIASAMLDPREEPLSFGFAPSDFGGGIEEPAPEPWMPLVDEGEEIEPAPPTGRSDFFDSWARRAIAPPLWRDDAPLSAPAAAEELVEPAPPEPERPPGRFELTVRDAPRDRAAGLDDAARARTAGDHLTAITLFTALLEREPRNVEAFNGLGSSLQAVGNHGAARDAYRSALDIDPRYAPAWSNLGVVLGLLGEEANALAALTEAVRLSPDNVGARVNLALAHQRRGNLEEARRTLDEVVRGSPQNAEAHYALARLLEQVGDSDGAAGAYRSFLATAGTRFPHLEDPVRQRIILLEALNAR